MSGAENPSDILCENLKNTTPNSTEPTLDENDFLNSSRRSKRLQKQDLVECTETESEDLLPKSPLAAVNESTEITTGQDEISSSQNLYEANEYLFGLYNDDVDSHSSNHRFYGCKKKNFPSPCSESFGLPDDPIFSNSPIFLERTRKSSLDVDLANPWEISVLDSENIDQPWLVENPEVITPYWDVESLFPFEEVRQKSEPEYDPSNSGNLSDSLNFSGGLDVSTDNENDTPNVFTSTPVKSNSSLSVVSTINITSAEENNVSMAALKDEVLKALEEAIKSKSNIGNIDMKIQIVTSDSKSPEASFTKSTVEVKINENVETESCRSYASSKENYFIENTQNVCKNSLNMKTKEVNNATLIDLNEDWQDGQDNDLTEQSQDEFNSENEGIESVSIRKVKKHKKAKRNSALAVRRSLRSNNLSAGSKEMGTNISTQLVCENSALETSKSQLDGEVLESDPAENRKRNLRSSTQKKENNSQCEISNTGDTQPLLENFCIDNLVGKSIHKGKLTTSEPSSEQYSQVKGDGKFVNKSKDMSCNEELLSSQDEQDDTADLGTKNPRVRRSFRIRNATLPPSQDKEEFDKSKQASNTDTQASLIPVDIGADILEDSIRKKQQIENIYTSEESSQEKPNINIMEKPRKSKILVKDTKQSSKNKIDDTVKIRRITRSQNDGLQSPINMLEMPTKLPVSNKVLQLTQDEGSNSTKSKRTVREKLQLSQGETSQNNSLIGGANELLKPTQFEPNITKNLSKKPKSGMTVQDKMQLSHDDTSQNYSFNSGANELLELTQFKPNITKNLNRKPKSDSTVRDKMQLNQGETSQNNSLPREVNNLLQSNQDKEKIYRLTRSKQSFEEGLQLDQNKETQNDNLGSQSGIPIKSLRSRELWLEQEVNAIKRPSRKSRSEVSYRYDSDSSQDEAIQNNIVLLPTSKIRKNTSKNFSETETEHSGSKELLQLSLNKAHISKGIRRKTRCERSFKEDESDSSKDNSDKPKRRERSFNSKLQEEQKEVSESFKNMESKKKKFGDTSLFRKKLRSSTQQLGLPENESNERRRRRTVSTSASEWASRENRHDNIPSRKRSVSANFDSRNIISNSTPIRRCLRSQVSKPTKEPDFPKPLENSTSRTPKSTSNIKSPKISFKLQSSFKESSKKFDNVSPIKSILKNVYDHAGKLIGVKVQKEKHHAMMPSALKIKPEKQMKAGEERLKNTMDEPPELELNVFNREDEKCRENGITSRIKIVISPFDIKEEKDDTVEKSGPPILPLAVPIEEAQSLRKSEKLGNVSQRKSDGKSETNSSLVSQQKTVENNELDINVIQAEENSDEINNVMPNICVEESKELKIDEAEYALGNFVWAQVGKYPFWPAIICYDPITQQFRKDVTKQNKPVQIYYHIRFFGDNGRRAWVYRKHIMLYCTDQDLKNIANKLKAENKTYNITKAYLLTGSSHVIEKWHKAVKELNSLKNKTYNAIIGHMVESYKNYIKSRKKRKLNSRSDASTLTELDGQDPSENRPLKKLKLSEQLHVTADLEIADNNVTLGSKPSDDFNEITITAVSQNVSSEKDLGSKVVENDLDAEHSSKPTPSLESIEDLETAEKLIERRLRRSLKAPETIEKSCLKDGHQPVPSENMEITETPSVPLVRTRERRSLRALKRTPQNIESTADQNSENEKALSTIGTKQPDEGSEAESKTSSDRRSINSNMYTFEYQMELHKKNNLFNGLRNSRVCDYCLKQGDLYKCKGKCGGFFHLECASKVTKPLTDRRIRKRERSPTKAKIRIATQSDSTPKSSTNREDRMTTRNQGQVQIITIKSKHHIGTPKKVNLPANFDELSLSEQIDCGMKEMMKKFENRTVYVDSTDSSSEEGSIIASRNKQLAAMDSSTLSVVVESEKSAPKSNDMEEIIEAEKNSDDLEVSTLSENAEKSNKLIKHVTADSIILTEVETPMDITNLKCSYCRLELDPPCYACGLEVSRKGLSARKKCSQNRCGRYYHPYCLKMWPQTQWSIGKWSRNQEQEDSFTCPAHTCHTCFSEELGSSACRLPGDKLARCMLCPAGFHTTTFCIPAGTDILGGSQIICPRHRPKTIQPINTIWCFICSEGGNLICCDTCPTSVHPECQPINLTDDDKYICEDCESGRFPLYDEIVWVKLGTYRWWPALVLFPNETPENVKALKHQRGDFAVRFFGTFDHYWVNKARSFLFQEGDRGGSPGEGNRSKNKIYEIFGKAIEDAALAYKLKKEFKLRREAESINSLKPPTYVKINKNKPVGNVKSLELNLSNANPCECDPKKPHPCGPDSNCINRLLMTECDPDVCPAGNRCRNQAFQRREYPPMIPYKTPERGWGLKSLAPIQKGQFVVEYVGELIDSDEYQRRIQKMHETKEENYYFMTVDSDRMIDAGPKGNLSRFMNHCCDPNCVTQKWTVRGDTRVGLFAKCDIATGSELTFNYNLEVVGQEKKVCRCGALNCSGFIGVKAKSDKLDKTNLDALSETTEVRKPRKYNKKRVVSPPLIPPCFMCGRKQSDLTCNNKFCNKGYHLKCLKLEEMPDVTKFTCPRHNCNLCSNRTIRCCVKCTNSFCPSHSEGNVRHDKFMGFVCRLHDPGISSTVLTSETVKEKKNSNSLRQNYHKPYGVSTVWKHKSINQYLPEEKDAIRARWRYYKKKQYDKEKLKKSLKNVKYKKIAQCSTKEKEAVREIWKRNKKSQYDKNKLLKLNMPEKFPNSKKQIESLGADLEQTEKKMSSKQQKGRETSADLGVLKKLINKGNKLKKVLKVRGAKNGNLRVKWKTTKKRAILENVELHGDVEVSQVNNVMQVQENDLVLRQDNEVLPGNKCIAANIEESREEHEVVGDAKVQNNAVTSENVDIFDVTQSVRSEFEPHARTVKRRRPKPDYTDESAVSSTTSDEESTTKPSTSQKSTEEISEKVLELQDSVSSTPLIEPAALSEIKENKNGAFAFVESNQNGSDSSDDDVPLHTRLRRTSKSRHTRKKFRSGVKKLQESAAS